MRVASLVPSATEMLFALGLGGSVVGVTHECDYPSPATKLPRLTRSVLPAHLPPSEMDAAVRATLASGKALYELDVELLADLGVDLIVTQAVCDVCAVSYDDVCTIALRLPSGPKVLSLDPATLGDVLEDVERLAAAADVEPAGRTLCKELADRLSAVRAAVADRPRPAVLALEWLDPPFVGGHWVPEMIDYAGGRDVLGLPGTRSRTATWDELAASRPEVVVVMPCGYDATTAAQQAWDYRDKLATLGARTVVAVDAAASFSRPGPRLVDGVELLAQLLHPDVATMPAAVTCEVIR
jgi:iron complex transport system substrate-binding protein